MIMYFPFCGSLRGDSDKSPFSVFFKSVFITKKIQKNYCIFEMVSIFKQSDIDKASKDALNQIFQVDNILYISGFLLGLLSFWVALECT